MMMLGGLFVDNEIYELGLELTKKIQQFYPNYKFVYDAEGNIIDVTATEPAEKLPEITLEQRVTATENAVEELISMIMGG